MAALAALAFGTVVSGSTAQDQCAVKPESFIPLPIESGKQDFDISNVSRESTYFTLGGNLALGGSILEGPLQGQAGLAQVDLSSNDVVYARALNQASTVVAITESATSPLNGLLVVVVADFDGAENTALLLAVGPDGDLERPPVAVPVPRSAAGGSASPLRASLLHINSPEVLVTATGAENLGFDTQLAIFSYSSQKHIHN